jgi:hypothetical protein
VIVARAAARWHCDAPCANGFAPRPFVARLRRQRASFVQHSTRSSRASQFDYKEHAMIQAFDQTINGTVMQFCASLGEGPTPHRVIISRADSAETLVILDAAGLISSIKAEIEEPEKLVADAIRKVQNDGLIEKALDTGVIQETSL